MAELNHTDMLMAEALKRSKPNMGLRSHTAYVASVTVWENCVAEIAKALGTPRRDPYNRFNRQKFIEACGIQGSLVE